MDIRIHARVRLAVVNDSGGRRVRGILGRRCTQLSHQRRYRERGEKDQNGDRGPAETEVPQKRKKADKHMIHHYTIMHRQEAVHDLQLVSRQ